MSKFLYAFIICAVIAGCSGGSVLTPGVDNQSSGSHAYNFTDSLPIIEGTMYSDGTFQSIGLMGAYELRIDPNDLTVELVSQRVPTLGESWTVSGIGFFTITPCSDCLKVDSFTLTAENYFQIQFHIKHPFKPGNTTLPPSAVNRLDLDVFDLALVVAPVDETPTDYPLTGTNAYAGILAENAGLTTELARVVSDDAAMPYALVVDDDAAAANTFNEFPMGADSFFDVFFDLNHTTGLNFELYLTMGYGASAQGKSQRLTPTYFNPEFNRKQAWKVVVTPPNGSDPPDRTNTWNDRVDNVPWNVTVEVFDWQQGVTTIANPPVNTGDIAFASDVSAVSVEIPGMTNTLQTATAPPTGTGAPGDPLVYIIPIMNENLLAVGEYLGLAKVSDERISTTTPPGAGIDFMIDAPDGITLTNFGIPEFATYQTFIATVVIGNLDPTASAVATTPTSVYDGQTVTFDATASVDPDGTITSYEWDFNEDGTYDGTGDAYTGDPWNPTHVFAYGDGSCDVQLRVTDNFGAQDTLDTPITITISPSKNLTPRAGFDIWDIATNETTGDVYILYSDMQIWKYNSLLGGGALYITPSWATTAGITGGRVEVATNGWLMVVGWPVSGSGWYASSINTVPSQVNWYGGWGTMAGDLHCESFASRNTSYNYPMGFTSWYPSNPSWTLNVLTQGPTYASYGGYVGSSSQTGNGYYGWASVKGAHCCYSATTSPEVFYVEGAPEYEVEQSRASGGSYPSYTWGSQTDANTGFNDPKDLTIDRADKIYIADILSTGERRIKAYTLTGTSLGAFGDNTSMAADPKRIEANWHTNDYIYVTMTNTVSIFFPPEHPF